MSEPAVPIDAPPKMDPVLASALLTAQREVAAAAKESFNRFHKYYYAGAEAVVSVGKEALNAVGCVLVPVTEDFTTLGQIDDRMGGAVATIRARYRVIHESGATYDFSTDVPVCPERGHSSGWSRPADKAAFGARSEALSYAYRDLLSIPREDAPDVSGREDRPQRAPEQPPPPTSIADALRDLADAPRFTDWMRVLQRCRQAVPKGDVLQLDGAFATRVEESMVAIATVDQLANVEGYIARLRMTGEPAVRIARALDAARTRIKAGAGGATS